MKVFPDSEVDSRSWALCPRCSLLKIWTLFHGPPFLTVFSLCLRVARKVLEFLIPLESFPYSSYFWFDSGFMFKAVYSRIRVLDDARSCDSRLCQVQCRSFWFSGSPCWCVSFYTGPVFLSGNCCCCDTTFAFAEFGLPRRQEQLTRSSRWDCSSSSCAVVGFEGVLTQRAGPYAGLTPAVRVSLHRSRTSSFCCRGFYICTEGSHPARFSRQVAQCVSLMVALVSRMFLQTVGRS